jgi:hypothetical protein
VNVRVAAAGGIFETDFIGDGEITVSREGNSRARHRFDFNGETLARLQWRGLRRAAYIADGIRYEITVGPLDRRISIISEDGNESFLVERSRANPNREELRVEMAEGDNFCLTRSQDSRLRADCSFTVSKQFYTSRLLVFRFNLRRRTQTTAQIAIKPVMKWEARYTHRLLALVVCRIILERRRFGARAIRLKEKPRRFSSSVRVRERKRTH